MFFSYKQLQYNVVFFSAQNMYYKWHTMVNLRPVGTSMWEALNIAPKKSNSYNNSPEE